jgi:HPt (histidine-containing phosphotransfer) domain-containing protein
LGGVETRRSESFAGVGGLEKRHRVPLWDAIFDSEPRGRLRDPRLIEVNDSKEFSVDLWPHACRIYCAAKTMWCLRILRKLNHFERAHLVDVATPLILNLPDLLNRVGDDRELLSELFFIFKSVFPTHLQALEAAISLKEAKTIASESHALKGMLLNLSAVRSAAAASKLEEMGRANRLDGLHEALAAFQFELTALLSQIEDSAAELSS